MKYLFVHNNFPAQFTHLASGLAAHDANVVKAIGASTAPGLVNVETRRYHPPDHQIGEAHPFARHFETECRRAEQVMLAAGSFAADGFAPDVIVAHCGWGENLPLRAIFPRAKIAIYCEFFFRAEGQDINFDPEGPTYGADAIVALHCRNASTLIALADADFAFSPTNWQRSTYPAEYQSKISVAHEGIDIEAAKPDDSAILTLPSGRMVRKGDEVVTFVARNLEQPRGYHIFMRALPHILRARPAAQVVIIGGDEHSYGPPPPPGATWKDVYLRENAENLDLSRVHFLGRVPRKVYLAALKVSMAHVYLTYPFVLSWSLLEAMGAGCTIVASDTKPVREVIDADSGVLTPFFDARALAERVIDVLSHSRDFRRLGARARQVAVARFDRVQCTNRLKSLIAAIPGGMASESWMTSERMSGVGK